MRKEILVAIIAGVFVGLAVAFGVWRANSALKTKLPVNNDQVASAQKSEKPPPPTNEFKITLARPEENEVLTDSLVNFSGITKQNSWIVISTEAEDFILAVSNDGSFEQEVTLEPSLNQIIVAAYDSENQQSQLTRSVIFSSEMKDFLSVEEKLNEESATESADSIRDRVRQKIEETKKNPLAYIGTVTDKTGSNLQIKNAKGEIQLVSVDPDATYAKIAKTTSSLSFDDIAIGDHIIAMGFLNGNGVLSTKRVLVTDPPTPSSRKIQQGEISKIEKRVVSISSNGVENDVEFPRKWKGPDLKELKEEDKVIVVTEPDKDKQIVRTIEIISISEIQDIPSPAPTE